MGLVLCLVLQVRGLQNALDCMLCKVVGTFWSPSPLGFAKVGWHTEFSVEGSILHPIECTTFVKGSLRSTVESPPYLVPQKPISSVLATGARRVRSLALICLFASCSLTPHSSAISPRTEVISHGFSP